MFIPIDSKKVTWAMLLVSFGIGAVIFIALWPHMILGTVAGTLLATEVVHIRPTATVTGRVVAPQLILGDGANFNGTVEPQHLEAALSVARHRRVGR